MIEKVLPPHMHLYQYTHQCQEAVQGLCSSDWRERVNVLKYHCVETQYVIETWSCAHLNVMYGWASEFRNTWSLYGAFHIPSAIPNLTFPTHLKPHPPYTSPPTYTIHTYSKYISHHTNNTHRHTETHTPHMTHTLHIHIHNAITHTYHTNTHHIPTTPTIWSGQKTWAFKDGGKNELCRVQVMPYMTQVLILLSR